MIEMIRVFILGKILGIKSPSLVFRGFENNTVWDCYKYNKRIIENNKNNKFKK